MLKKLAFLVVMIATLATSPARALEEDYGSVEFLSGWRLPDGSYQAAIAFNLNDGWKTYWRVPGPAGLPTNFNWLGSTNIGDIQIDWPAPGTFESFGLVSFGYKHRLVLPVRITPEDPARPVRVDLKLQFGVCSDICYPGATVIRETLTPDMPEEGRADIRNALSSRAAPLSRIGSGAVSCVFRPKDRGLLINTTLDLAPGAVERYVVLEYPGNDDIWIDVASLSGAGRKVLAESVLKYYGKGMLSVDRSKLRVTVLQDGAAFETYGCPSP